MSMYQASEIGNPDGYKSYIQRRRVGSDNSENDFVAESNTDKSPISDVDDLSLVNDHKTYEGFFSQHRESNEKNTYNSYNTNSHQYNYPKRMETSIYQRKRPGAYGATNSTAIEENKATLLAIKIIKQALACFAILGVIVFLQQRADASPVLNYIKSQVVDNHTEASSPTSGVENIITECSRIFGGSP